MKRPRRGGRVRRQPEAGEADRQKRLTERNRVKEVGLGLVLGSLRVTTLDRTVAS